MGDNIKSMRYVSFRLSILCAITFIVPATNSYNNSYNKKLRLTLEFVIHNPFCDYYGEIVVRFFVVEHLVVTKSPMSILTGPSFSIVVPTVPVR